MPYDQRSPQRVRPVADKIDNPERTGARENFRSRQIRTLQ